MVAIVTRPILCHSQQQNYKTQVFVKFIPKKVQWNFMKFGILDCLGFAMTPRPTNSGYHGEKFQHKWQHKYYFYTYMPFYPKYNLLNML